MFFNYRFYNINFDIEAWTWSKCLVNAIEFVLDNSNENGSIYLSNSTLDTEKEIVFLFYSIANRKKQLENFEVINTNNICEEMKYVIVTKDEKINKVDNYEKVTFGNYIVLIKEEKR